MIPAVLWLCYAVPAYVLYPVVFRLRHGFSAVKERFPPRTRYEWVDFGLGIALTAYSLRVGVPLALPALAERVGLRHVPEAKAVWLIAGAALWTAGCGLRVWSVWALGRSWRIGQDTTDSAAVHVTRGPYRHLKHPINAALVVVATGQCVMTDFEPGSIGMLAGAAVYYLIQGRAEERYWAARAAGKPDGGEGGGREVTR